MAVRGFFGYRLRVGGLAVAMVIASMMILFAFRQQCEVDNLIVSSMMIFVETGHPGGLESHEAGHPAALWAMRPGTRRP